MEIELGFFEKRTQQFKEKYNDMDRKTSNIKIMGKYEELLSKLRKIVSDLNAIESMDEFITQCNLDFVPDISYKNIIAELDGVLIDGSTGQITKLEQIISELDKKLYEQTLIRKNKCNDFLEDLFNDKKSILDCFNQTNNLEELKRKENAIKSMKIEKETVIVVNKYIEEKNKLFDSLGIDDDIAEVLLKLNKGLAVLDDISGESIKKWLSENHVGKQIKSRIRLNLS